MRRAFMFPDVMVGIGIVTVLLLIMTITMARQQRATAALAEHRNATRAAEDALIDLRAGRAISQAKSVSAHDVPDSAAPPGYRWVQVEATSGKQRSVILGVVPRDASSTPATQPARGRP